MNSSREVLELSDRVCALSDELAAVALMSIEALRAVADNGEKGELARKQRQVRDQVRRLEELKAVLRSKLTIG